MTVKQNVSNASLNKTFPSDTIHAIPNTFSLEVLCVKIYLTECILWLSFLPVASSFQQLIYKFKKNKYRYIFFLKFKCIVRVFKKPLSLSKVDASLTQIIADALLYYNPVHIVSSFWWIVLYFNLFHSCGGNLVADVTGGKGYAHFSGKLDIVAIAVVHECKQSYIFHVQPCERQTSLDRCRRLCCVLWWIACPPADRAPYSSRT